MPPKKQSACKRSRGKSKQTSLLDFEPRKRGRRAPGSSAVASASAPTVQRGAPQRRAEPAPKTAAGGRSAADSLAAFAGDGNCKLGVELKPSKKRGRQPKVVAANTANTILAKAGAAGARRNEGPAKDGGGSKKGGRSRKSAAAVNSAALATADAMACNSANEERSNDNPATAGAKRRYSNDPPRKKRVTVVCDVTVAEWKGMTTTAKKQAKKLSSDAQSQARRPSVTPSPELLARKDFHDSAEGELSSSFFPKGKDATFCLLFDDGNDEGGCDDETAQKSGDEEKTDNGACGPAFHEPWHQPYRPSATLPSGVVDIDVLPHRCCDHSLHSHAGYSWLTSKRRCGCTKDSNHNSSESMSESYLASYGVERYSDVGMAGSGNEADWKAEAWWLDQTRRERRAASRSASARCDSLLARLPLPTSVAEHIDYMSRQSHVTMKMRAMVTDWMCDVALEYNLSVEALWLSAALFDRSLACSYGIAPPDYGKKWKNRKMAMIPIEKSVIGGEMLAPKDMLQLVGGACIMIACKMVEVVQPSVKDFVDISGRDYTGQELLDMESRITGALKFNLNIRTPYHYVDRFLRASYASSECSTLGSHDASVAMGGGANNATNALLKKMVHYLLDLSILEYELATKKPSLVAASAIYLARASLGIHQPTDSTLERTQNGFWSQTLEYYTGYDLRDLEECVRLLHGLQGGAEENDLKTIFNKHKDRKHGRVALRIVLRENELGFV